MRPNNVPVYLNPHNSYRIALMQGYDIQEYTPFMKLKAPLKSLVSLVGTDRFCGDAQDVITSYTCAECSTAFLNKMKMSACARVLLVFAMCRTMDGTIM